jgi:hypothetical protein
VRSLSTGHPAAVHLLVRLPPLVQPAIRPAHGVPPGVVVAGPELAEGRVAPAGAECKVEQEAEDPPLVDAVGVGTHRLVPVPGRPDAMRARVAQHAVARDRVLGDPAPLLVRGVVEAGVQEGDVGADGGVGDLRAQLAVGDAHAPGAAVGDEAVDQVVGEAMHVVKGLWVGAADVCLPEVGAPARLGELVGFLPEARLVLDAREDHGGLVLLEQRRERAGLLRLQRGLELPLDPLRLALGGVPVCMPERLLASVPSPGDHGAVRHRLSPAGALGSYQTR